MKARKNTVRSGFALSKPALFLFLVLLVLRGSLGAQPVQVRSFSPGTGPAGTAVTVVGRGFSPLPAHNTVWFGAAPAEVVSASDTSLVVLAPQGATYGPLVVTAAGKTGSSEVPFNLTFPSGGTFGAGSFAPRHDYTSIGDGPYRVALADIDGDGKNDMVVANYQGSSFAVLRNTTSGDTLTDLSFSAELDLSTPLFPVSLVVSDIDGDGRLDIVLGTQYSPSVFIFLNRSEPGTTACDPPVTVSLASGFKSVACGDFDHDGMTDIAVANREANTLQILRNTSAGGVTSFVVAAVWSTPPSPGTLIAADLDGDGQIDLATADRGASSVTVYRNVGVNGSMNFDSGRSMECPGSPASLAAADLDGDGRLDLAAVCSGVNLVSLLHNEGSPGVIQFAARRDVPTIESPTNISCGDVTGDGLPDVAVVSGSIGTVAVHRNISSWNSPSIEGAFLFTVNSPSMGLAIGDLTQNGKPDIAAGSFTANTVSVLRNAILPPPLLHVSDSTVLFPERMVGDSVAVEITLRDDSPSPLTVAALSVSTTNFSPPFSVPALIPGFGSVTVRIVFHPSAFGSFEDTLKIISDGGNAMIRLTGSSPAPVLLAQPTALDFGTVSQYFSLSRRVRITNTSINPLRIDTIRVRTASYVVTPAAGMVSRGDSLFVTATFTPATLGTLLDSIMLISNAPLSPSSIPLRGEGTPTTPLATHLGWSMLSLPRTPPSGNVSTIFPDGSAQVYLFNASSQRYDAASVLAPGPGFWLLYDRDTIALLSGTPVDSIGLTVAQPGWILVGSVVTPVPLNHVTTVPDGSLAGPLYHYNAASQRYEAATALTPGRGYWALVGRPCIIRITR